MLCKNCKTFEVYLDNLCLDCYQASIEEGGESSYNEEDALEIDRIVNKY